MVQQEQIYFGKKVIFLTKGSHRSFKHFFSPVVDNVMLTEICSVKIEIAIKYEYLIAFYANGNSEMYS